MRVLLLPLLALASCAPAPAPTVSKQGAAANYTTTKPPKVIAECLQGKIGPVALVKEGNLAIITSRDAPKLSLRIYDNGRVEVTSSIPFEGQSRSAMESCILAQSGGSTVSRA